MNIRQEVYLSIVLVIGLITVGSVFATTVCKKCGPNYIACVNETSYTYCPDGVTPSKQGGTCPIGQVCTDEQQFCQPKATAKKVCGNCETCTSGFVCRSQTQFEYCQGTVPTGIIGKCTKGQYCSVANVVKNHNICIESCLDEPTCYAAEVSTTPAPPKEQDYTKSCVGTTTFGNYENLADPSCKSYVYCELLNGVMNSVLFECKSGYFSATQKKCIPTKPNKCT